MRFSSLGMKMALLAVAAACLFSISPASLSFWRLANGKLVKTTPPDEAINVIEPTTNLTGDLDGNGRMECVSVTHETASITDCGNATLWQSSPEWQVKQALISDLNRDHKPEVTLLVWRPFSAWPIDKFLPAGGRIQDFQDRRGMSCHLILLGWNGTEYREFWAGSALIRPVEQIAAADLDGDGFQELAALEGDYDAASSGGTLTVWKWQGFGFVLIDETKERFSSLRVIGNTGDVWLMVQR